MVNNTGIPAYYNWTIDITNPTTAILSGPELFSNVTSATFQFNSSEANSTFECRLDSSNWSLCESNLSYSSLDEGKHLFQVVSIDVARYAGNIVDYNWTIDITSPVITMNTTTANISNNQTSLFDFTADENATFECDFDGSGWYDCVSPVIFTNLSETYHVFKVRATDNFNNTGLAFLFNWTVDVTAPVTNLTSGPSSLTNLTTAIFEFNSTGIDSVHECALDSQTNWSYCTSPVVLTNLPDGEHIFIVKATDEAGNTGNLVNWTWTIDTEKPYAEIEDINSSLK